MSNTVRKPFPEYLKLARTSAGYANRELAAIVAPFSPETIGRHERGENEIHPADVIIYANSYEKPDLLIRFCSYCPIGQKTRPQVQDRDLPWVALRVSQRLSKAAKLADRLQEIAMDGIVSADERGDFNKVLDYLRQVEETTADAILWAMSEDGIHNIKKDPFCVNRIGSR